MWWSTEDDIGKPVGATLAMRVNLKGRFHGLEHLVSSFAYPGWFHCPSWVHSDLPALVLMGRSSTGAESSYVDASDDESEDLNEPVDHTVLFVPVHGDFNCHAVQLQQKIAANWLRAACNHLLAFCPPPERPGIDVSLVSMISGCLVKTFHVPEGEAVLPECMDLSAHWLVVGSSLPADPPASASAPGLCGFLNAPHDSSTDVIAMMAKAFAPKWADFNLDIWPLHGRATSHKRLVALGRRQVCEPMCVTVVGSTACYSIGPDCAMVAVDVVTNSSLWTCELMHADEEPSTADRIWNIRSDGTHFLACLHNDNPFSTVFQVEGLTGSIVFIFSTIQYTSWDVRHGVMAQVTHVSEVEDYYSGCKATVKEHGLSIWRDGSLGRKRMFVPGEFKDVAVGATWAAAFCTSGGMLQVQVYGFGNDDIQIMQSHQIPIVGAQCVSVLVWTPPPAERYLGPTPTETTPIPCLGVVRMALATVVLAWKLRAWRLLLRLRTILQFLIARAFVSRRMSWGYERIDGDAVSSSDSELGQPDIGSETILPLHTSIADNALGSESQQSHVLQDIVHDEPSTIIDPDEASAITHEQWATSRLQPALAAKAFEQIDILVLALTKHSHDIEAALLNTSVAMRLKSEGFDVKPDWAGGAKVFVKEFGPGEAAEFRACFGQSIGLGPSHIVVRPEEEATILAAFKLSRKCRSLATVKPGSRMQMPHEVDWLDISSLGSSGSTVEATSWFGADLSTHVGCEAQTLELLSFNIVVKHTFVHAEPIDRAVCSMRKCRSDSCMVVGRS